MAVLTITTLGVASSTSTTAVITWTTTGTSAASDTRVSYTGGGVTNSYIDGARVTSHSATLTGLQPGVIYTYTVSSQSATETATGAAATFSTCQPNSGKLTSVKATLYSFYAYGSFTATWHDLSGIGTTPTQCGVAITTPVSGTLDINGNLEVSLPDVNQVTPSPGAWTIALSSFASTGSVSVDISPTGQNFDASATIQAVVSSSNKGPIGGTGGAGTGTVTSFSAGTLSPLFTTSVATSTVTPALSFSLSTASAHSFLGNNTGSTAAPAYAALALADLPGTVVNATSPGAGIAHFAGSTQTVTSSAVVNADIAAATIDLTSKVTGALPVANGGTGVATLTAHGVVVGNAASAVSVTGAGTSGQVLTSNGASADPTFQAAAGGALVQVETHAAASSAALNFTTGITSTYKTYKIVLRNLVPATNAVSLNMQFSSDGGATYISDSHYTSAGWRFNTGGGAAASVSNANQFRIDTNPGSATVDNTSTDGVCGEYILCDPQSATLNKKLVGHVTDMVSGGSQEGAVVTLNWATSGTAVNAFRVLFSSGNIASGTVTLYGLTP